MTYAGWYIDLLSFEGKDDKSVKLSFASGLTLIYGASNTGKILRAEGFGLYARRKRGAPEH
jgi:hypothetical protein